MKNHFLSLILFLLSTSPVLSNQDTLKQIFADEWQQRMDTNPIFASAMNKVPATSLADNSFAALTKQAEFDRSILKRLNRINYQQLDNVSQINYRIFKDQIKNNIASFEFGEYQIPFNSDSSFYSGFARIAYRIPMHTEQDYLNYLSILASWPDHVDQQIAHMQTGLKRGMTQPKELVENITSTITPFITSDAKTSIFFKPFQNFPKNITEQQRKQLIIKAKQVIIESVIPAYQKLADFMDNQYIPGARESLGATDLPDGKQYYSQRVKHFTTLDISVDEVHKIGLNEVKRIRNEMQQVIDNLEFKGTFKDFITYLRTDPKFYAKTAEDLLKQAAWIAKRMDAKLPSLFNHLPRLPYGVQAVPASIAPTYTTGRYVSAAKGSTQPGYYWVNTHALDKRPLYVLESLTFPG